MRSYKKLVDDLQEWHDWCVDNPTNKDRVDIAYHLNEILAIIKGEKE